MPQPPACVSGLVLSVTSAGVPEGQLRVPGWGSEGGKKPLAIHQFFDEQLQGLDNLFARMAWGV